VIALVLVMVTTALTIAPQTVVALSIHNITNQTDLSSGGKLIIGFEQHPYPVGQQYDPSTHIPRLGASR
jgi:hypothetical protein